MNPHNLALEPATDFAEQFDAGAERLADTISPEISVGGTTRPFGHQIARFLILALAMSEGTSAL